MSTEDAATSAREKSQLIHVDSRGIDSRTIAIALLTASIADLPTQYCIGQPLLNWYELPPFTFIKGGT
jgi:hypothetical protein